MLLTGVKEENVVFAANIYLNAFSKNYSVCTAERIYKTEKTRHRPVSTDHGIPVAIFHPPPVSFTAAVAQIKVSNGCSYFVKDGSIEKQAECQYVLEQRSVPVHTLNSLACKLGTHIVITRNVTKKP